MAVSTINNYQNQIDAVNTKCDTKVTLVDNTSAKGIDFGGNVNHISFNANGDGNGFNIRCYLNNGISVRLYFDLSMGLLQYFDTQWHTVHQFY